jgi:hypothetical protein
MINSRRRGNQFALLLSAFVLVFGSQDDDTTHALLRPASKKRQGTKSREVWHPAVQRVLWGSYVGGDLDGGRGASTRRRACAHTGEPGRVQWTSRRAYGIHQWSVGELMGGIGSRGGKPHGRMLPQLWRFGMNVAKKYF